MSRKIVIGALAVACLMAAAVTQTHAAMAASVHRITINVWKAGFIVGGSGGGGTLYYGGRAHGLNIGGIRLGATFGVSKANLTGKAYGMRRLSDIEGVYTAGEAAVAVVGGVKVWTLSNGKGVTLKLQGKQVGLDFSLDVGGMSIALK